MTNTRPDLLLSDNAPVRCSFMIQDDAPVFWLECQTNATEKIHGDELRRWLEWKTMFPNAIIAFRPGEPYLCDKHCRILREIVTGG